MTFLGAPALAAVALVQARRSGSAKTAGWIVAGLAFYTVMVVVTFAVHFPLNDELKEAGDPARIENLPAVRDDFVTAWVAWDIVRTLASTDAGWPISASVRGVRSQRSTLRVSLSPIAPPRRS